MTSHRGSSGPRPTPRRLMRILQKLGQSTPASASRTTPHSPELSPDDDFAIWGGNPPTAELLAAGSMAPNLCLLDRTVAEAIASTSPTTQRSIARWAARTAIDRADLSNTQWVQDGLNALAEQVALPAPFAGLFNARQRVETAPALRRFRARATPALRNQQLARQVFAVSSLTSAGAADPARAALDATYFAVVDDEDTQLLSGEIRSKFLPRERGRARSGVRPPEAGMFIAGPGPRCAQDDRPRSTPGSCHSTTEFRGAAPGRTYVAEWPSSSPSAPRP